MLLLSLKHNEQFKRGIQGTEESASFILCQFTRIFVCIHTCLSYVLCYISASFASVFSSAHQDSFRFLFT
jgi:hypothetical protein